MELVGKDKRSHLRGDLSFIVKFRIVTPEEYETFKNSDDQFLSLDKVPTTDVNKAHEADRQVNPNPYVLDLLLQSEEKLDQILDLLSDREVDNGFLEQGLGLNISGSGMNMVAEKPVEPGKILHTSFLLSRFPVVFIRVFGEVVRVKPVREKGKTSYDLGIKFLYLNPDDREKIIACVFQSHRNALKIRKSEMMNGKDR